MEKDKTSAAKKLILASRSFFANGLTNE